MIYEESQHGKSVMLEVGQPGELPLMRELTALRKSRCLRDPSTNSSWKSPVLGATSSSTADLKAPGDRVEADGGAIRDELRGEHMPGGSGRRDSGRGAAKRGSCRSEPLISDVDPRLSWDLGRDPTVGVDMRDEMANELQRENIKNHLEKMGILGETIGWGRQVGGKSLLHNWKTANYIADSEGGGTADLEGGGAEAAESIRQRGQRQSTRDTLMRDRSWPDARDQGGFDNHAESRRFLPRQEDAGRNNAFYKTSRNTKGDRLSRQDAQILSPLILNSHDDIKKFSQSQSLFTLEEPYDEEEQYLEEEFQSGLAVVQREVSALNVGSRSQSPLSTNDAPRSGKKQTHNSNTRSSQVFSNPANNNNQPRRSVSASWEAKHLEFEVGALERPRNESGRPHYRPKNQQKLVKTLSDVQGRSLPHGFTNAARRKGGNATDHRSGSQQETFAAPYTSRSPAPPQIEPLPLLTELEDFSGSDDCAGSSADGDSDRPLSDLHGELGLDALNASGGQHGVRESDVAHTQGLQLAISEGRELALCEERPRSLSQKYRPKAFEEVVGQNIVTQALSNAILKGKIAPVYLFQGSRGTGKTSAARIFAAALICISPEERRPCGFCRECITVASGKSSDVKEVDAASNNGIERVKALLDETISAPSVSRYKVFIIDECHMLTTETWNALLKILEEPPMNVVFILITTDPDQLPRTAVSRCQKFPFPKIKDSEIVKRLQKLAGLENLELELETLHLIASRSDGSLRDAETTLDQLSLLGQKISPSTVHELVGSASDERLLSLLDSALLADTVSTVRRARELVESGVEPLALMSQLATLITDILAGSYKFLDKQRRGFFRRHTLSEEKLERLRMAMRTLSEAEKQLRVSNDRTTWLTAALLQLGPDRSFMLTASCAGTSVTQSPVALDDVGDNEVMDYETVCARQTWDEDGNDCQQLSMDSLAASKSEVTSNDGNVHGMNMKPSTQGTHWSVNKGNVMSSAKFQAKIRPADRSAIYSEAVQEPLKVVEQEQLGEASLTDSPDTIDVNNKDVQFLSTSKLDDIWCRVVEGCRPLPLRQLLHAQGKLLSISLSEVDAVAHLEFCHPEHKSRCERSRKSISNVFEAILGTPVEVKISLASLPAEEHSNSRTWVSAERSRTTQGFFKRNNGVSSSDSRLLPEDVSLESSSLNSWKNQGGVAVRNVSQQSNASECFPAIPQAPFASVPKEIQRFDAVGSNWTSNNLSCADNGGRPGQGAEAGIPEEEQLENAWVHETRRFRPLLPSSGCGELTDTIELPNDLLHQDGARRAPVQARVQETSVTANDYMHNLDYNHGDGLSSEEQGDIDEHDFSSPESHEAATLPDDLEEQILQRHDISEANVDSRSCSLEEPRSSDADLQKRKGSTLKIVRRLTMSSRIKSLPNSVQNSPDEKGSSLKVPRFTMKSHIKSLTSRNTKNSIDSSGISEQVADTLENDNNALAPQKRGKLIEAAGSFARFFQGKRSSRQVNDVTSQ